MPVAGVLVARLEPPLSTSRRRSCVAPGLPTRHARSTGHVTCPGFPDGRGWVAVMSLRSRREDQQTRSEPIGIRREGGQVRAAEAGRRGSVGHVEVFRMDGVGTSIVGRPRRLSADRRARPTYTLIWEEPRDVFADDGTGEEEGAVSERNGACSASTPPQAPVKRSALVGRRRSPPDGGVPHARRLRRSAARSPSGRIKR